MKANHSLATEAPDEALWHRRRRWLYLTMLLSACLSLYASFVLSVDALALAADPSATFSCDLNAALSCSKVGASPQASLLGFPNAYLGLMTEPVVITLAVLGMAGARLPRWFLAAAQGVYLAGLIFAYWLFYQSYEVIGALCPYCLIITVGTTLVFFTLLTVNLREGNLLPSGSLRTRGESFARLGGPTLVAGALVLGLGVLIMVKYGPLLLG